MPIQTKPGPKASKPFPPKIKPSHLLWMVAGVLFGLSLLNQFGAGPPPIPYSQFEQYLAQDKIARLTVAGDMIRGVFKQPEADGATGFTTLRVPPDIAVELAKHGVEFSGAASGSPLGALLGWVLPPLLFVGIWLVASRYMMGGRRGGGLLGGGLLSAGRSRAKLVAETDVQTSFDDVAGVD